MMNARIQRRGGGRGSGPLPLKNHKDIGFLSNTGPDPLKNHRLKMLGPTRPASETTFIGNGVSLAGQ